MSSERLSLATPIEVAGLPAAEDLLRSEEFDLDAFFEVEEGVAEPEGQNTVAPIPPAAVRSPDSKTLQNPALSPPKDTPAAMPDLLVTLRNDADESITTIATKVTASSFAAGASLTSSVFTALNSLVGSCGIFCVHSLGSLSKMPSLLSGGAGVGGLGGGLASSGGGFKMPNFRTDKHGNFHLDGNIDMLSRATGISKKDLMSGRFSAEDILVAFFSVFGDGIGAVFGLGIIESLVGGMFDSFLSNQSESSLAA